MSRALDPFVIMAYRQFRRFLRTKARVVTSILNPIIWIAFFGLGWANAFNFPMAKAIFGGVDYLTFLTPGVTAMAVFTASFIGGVTVIWDKQFGFLKEVLVAPASRTGIILGRIFGDAVIAVLQGLAIMALSFTIAHNLNPYGVLPALAYAFILALGFTSAGVALALKMTSMEGFQMVVSLLMMPLVFLSGAFYPIKFMPDWMKWVAYINPLTYAVDGMRHYLSGVSTFNPLTDLAVLCVITAAFMALASKLFEKATID